MSHHVSPRNETVADSGCALVVILLCIVVACGFAMSECDSADAPVGITQ